MYMLASLSALGSTWALAQWLDCVTSKGSGSKATWALPLYIFLVVVTCYSHYFAVTIVLAQNVAVATFILSEVLRNWHNHLPHSASHPPVPWNTIVTWSVAQLIVVAGYMPWLLLSRHSLQAWPAISEPFTLWDLLGRVMRLLPLGLIASEDYGALWPGLLLSSFLLPALALKDKRGSPRMGKALLAFQVLTPLLLMYGLSRGRPMYRAKFLLVVAPAYHILQAQGILSLALMAARRFAHVSAVRLAAIAALVLLVLAAMASPLMRLYSDRKHFRDDYRGIVHYVEATAGSDSAIVINAPAQIETVNYYYRGPWPEYPLPRQRPIDVAQTESELRRIIARHSRLYAIYWATNESDPEGFIEGWLDAHCFKALNTWFGNVRLVVYAVPQQEPTETEHTVDYRFGESIHLIGYNLLTPHPRSGDILQLSLFWETLAPIPKRYKIFTHLVDARGNIVGQRDSEPGGGGRLTTTWQVGERVVDNYGLPILPGTPPGRHILRVGLYGLDDSMRLPVYHDEKNMGDAVDLAEVYLDPASAPPPIGALGIQSLDRLTWGDLELIGHSLYRQGFEHESELHIRAGDVLRLELYWRRAGLAVSDGLTVSLKKERKLAFESPLKITDSIYPPAEWQLGEIVRDIHRLPLPSDLPPGAYELLLTVGRGKAQRLQRVIVRP